MRTHRLVAATLLALLAAPSDAAAQAEHRMAPFSAPTTQAPVGPLASALQAAHASEYVRAETELGAIRGAERPAAQVALARILLEQGRYADADRVAQAAGGTSDEKNQALAIRAQTLFAKGDQTGAVRLLETAKDSPGRGGRAVKLLLGEYRIATGHRPDATAPLHAIIDDYNADRITATDAEGLAVAGRAAYLLRSPKDANKLLNEAERADPTLVDGLLWHAELFLDTYDPGHAEETLNQARKVAPHRPDLAIMLAHVKLDQTLDFDAADTLTKDALAVNPHLASAYAVRASVALRDADLDVAAAAVTSGLAEDQNNLELLTLRAAERFLAEDHAGFLEAKKQVFLRNAADAKFFEVVSDFAEWEHRYEDIILLMKEAVLLDPDDGKAYAELGLTQMRDGNEQDGGRVAVTHEGTAPSHTHPMMREHLHRIVNKAHNWLLAHGR